MAQHNNNDDDDIMGGFSGTLGGGADELLRGGRSGDTTSVIPDDEEVHAKGKKPEAKGVLTPEKEKLENDDDDLSNTTLEIEEDETIEVPEITPPPSSAPVAAPAVTPAHPVFDASAVADAIFAKAEYRDALTKRVAEIFEGTAAEKQRAAEKAEKEQRRRQTTIPAQQVAQPEAEPSWRGWLKTGCVILIALAIISFCLWGGILLFDGKSGTTPPDAGVDAQRRTLESAVMEEFVDPVIVTNPNQSSTPAPQPGCDSSLDLAHAPYDVTERMNLNCHHDVFCPPGIDFAARERNNGNERYYDLSPDANGDIEAERLGCRHRE